MTKSLEARLPPQSAFEDGFLYDTELRPFADKFGFEGSQNEWVGSQERTHLFTGLCVGQ